MKSNKMKPNKKQSAATSTKALIGLTLVNPKNGDTFQSDFASDADAAARLKERLDAGEFGEPGSKGYGFAADMWTCILVPGKLTPGRRFYIHKLATEGNAPRHSAGQYDLTGVLTLLRKAKQHLKFPALVLTLTDGTEAKVSLAGDKSKNPGAVYIASKAFRGPYYGKVQPDGNFYQGRDFKPEVGSLLEELAKDPAGAAAKQGHLTGKCCFCGLPLSDERSTEVGYGSTCAKHYGLPWGAEVKSVSKRKAAASKPKPEPPAKVASKPKRKLSR
jgi:hypothetical protein